METPPKTAVPPSSPSPRESFYALNSLRGAAAIIVALFHAAVYLDFQLAPYGYLAVDLFFILSGAVIAHAYETRLDSGLGFSKFMRLRLIRFYPLYALGLLFGAALALALQLTASPYALAPSSFLLALVFGVLFLPAFAGVQAQGSMYPLNIPAWSLFYELIANAIYALLPKGRRFTLTLLLTAALLPIVVSGLLGFADYKTGPNLQDFWQTLARATFTFGIGVILYRLRRLATIQVPPWIVIGLVTATMLVPVGNAWIGVHHAVCVLLMYPLATWLLLRHTEQPANGAIHSALGDISYGLYALHYPILGLANGILPRLGLPVAPFIFLTLVVLCVAVLIYERRVDTPLRKRLTAWILAPRSTQVIGPEMAQGQSTPGAPKRDGL